MAKASPEKFVIVTVPQEAWDVLHETLQMDSESSSFDHKLRDQILKALDSIEALNYRKVGRKWRWVLKMPEDAWDVLWETLSMDARSKWFDEDLKKEIRRALDRVEVEYVSPRDWSPRWSGG